MLLLQLIILKCDDLYIYIYIYITSKKILHLLGHQSFAKETLFESFAKMLVKLDLH